jgi:hypothetical protein
MTVWLNLEFYNNWRTEPRPVESDFCKEKGLKHAFTIYLNG